MFNKFYQLLKPLKTKILCYFIIGLGVLVFFESTFFDLKNKDIVARETELIEKKADVVFAFLDKEYVSADTFVSDNASLIRKNLLEAYNDDFNSLATDLYSLKEMKKTNVKASDVIAKTIENISFGDVSKDVFDNNNMIVFLSDFIICDLSQYYATDGKIRTVKDDIGNQSNKKGHFAKTLGINTLEDITRNGVSKSYWHRKYIDDKLPWASDIKSMKKADLMELRKMFIQYQGNLDFFNGFGFLTISRIDNNTDINGKYVVQPNGTRNDNNVQLDVVQEFNLIDQLKLCPSTVETIKEIDLELKEIKNEKDREKFYKDLKIYTSFVIFLFLFLLIHKHEE